MTHCTDLKRRSAPQALPCCPSSPTLTLPCSVSSLICSTTQLGGVQRHTDSMPAGTHRRHPLPQILMCAPLRRTAAMAVCRGWRAVVLGDPHFWPAVALRGSLAVVRKPGWMLQDRALQGGTAAREVDTVLVASELDARASVLRDAARLSTHTARVLLEDFSDQVGSGLGHATHVCLHAMPSSGC